MMMPKRLCYALILWILLVQDLSLAEDVTLAGKSPNYWEEYEGISMIQLIATPEKYNGRKFSVCGFARIEFEATALYHSQGDRKYGLSKNALWLNLGKGREDKRLDGKLIRVFGVFDAQQKGHKGSYSGGLREIERMDRLGIPDRR
jgi:hypothetical protein